MKDEKAELRAFVQTAEQAGDYIWVIALIDFGARELKRTIVSDEKYKFRAAAQDAGEARLKALQEDRHAHA